MTYRNYLFLFVISLAVTTGIALFQAAPGYMDAEYYYAGGVQLSSGRGFQEPFLWNYLDSPAGLPHPSHTYWMPLASLIAAIVPGIVRLGGFELARIPFILIAGMVAPLTAALAYSYDCQKKNAFIAGLLAVFPGYYLAYYPTTDTFAIYMVLGTIFLLLGKKYLTSTIPRQYGMGFLLGLTTGLMHLSRADGLLWFGFASAIMLYRGYTHRKVNIPGLQSASLTSLAALGMGLVGYLIPMAAWFARNMALYGSLMAPGGSHALWVRSYNQLFVFPADILTFQYWWGQGGAAIFSARLQALLLNLKTAVGVQFGIVFLPFALIGAWKFRKNPVVQLGLIGWVGTFLAMTLVFPFAGSRGGFFHSGAAVQPFLWSLVPAGLAILVEWAGRMRGWKKTNQAATVFRISLVGAAVLISLGLGYLMVLGENPMNPAWNQGWDESKKLGIVLDGMGIPKSEVILVNNPPGFYAATGRPAIVIPDGNESTSLAAAKMYGAAYLILQKNHPDGLDALYKAPTDRPGLDFLKTVDGAHYFRTLP